MKKIAVCLSGCGVFDGAEIHEAVCTLLALDQAGAKYLCCAPNIAQTSVLDHTNKRPVKETRNVLVEAARIARGEIRDVKDIRAVEIDGLIFPGGLGAAKNLCTYAADGANCTVNPDVERLVGEMLVAKKPIGAICIAPAMLARVVGRKDLHPRMTIGSDASTASALAQMGAQHVNCPATDAVTDESHKIVTTPAYMLANGPAQVYEGVRKLVQEVLRLI